MVSRLMYDEAFNVIKWATGLLHELEGWQSTTLSLLAYPENIL